MKAAAVDAALVVSTSKRSCKRMANSPNHFQNASLVTKTKIAQQTTPVMGANKLQNKLQAPVKEKASKPLITSNKLKAPAKDVRSKPKTGCDNQIAFDLDVADR